MDILRVGLWISVVVVVIELHIGRTGHAGSGGQPGRHLGPTGEAQPDTGTAMMAGTTFSIGWTMWAVRGGYLATSLLTSLPSWQFIDPLPIFDDTNTKSRKPSMNDEKDSSLVDIMQNADPQS